MIPSFSRTLLLAGGLALLGASGLGLGPVLADPIVPLPQTCATLNCNSLLLPGRTNPHPEVPALSSGWVVQVVGVSGSCLRLHVVAQQADFAMSVVAPDGVVFTNDTGGVAPCPACPRVVVAASRTGAYTVVLNNRTGAATEAAFQLRAGLYNTGNPNCAAPTTGR